MSRTRRNPRVCHHWNTRHIKTQQTRKMEASAEDQLDGQGGNRQKTRANPSGVIPTHWDEHYNSAAKEWPARKGENLKCPACCEARRGAAEPL